MTASKLPSADWQNAASLKSIITALQDQHGGPRFVGGAVRDALLGLEVSDVDLATTLLPADVISRLEAARIKAVPTGIDHGTVTAVADGRNYEITTLRRDVATDGRRATVAFATDWREDAARRDFTINALYADPETGEIFDYFGGMDDLAAGIIRFIGDAQQRIAEDYLRVLRYFRFLARYGNGALDSDAIAACERGASGLTALSRERIAQELVRLMSLPDPAKSVALMIEHAIFAPFLPELPADAEDALKQLVRRERKFGQQISLPARMLTIFPRDLSGADWVAARLKLSNRLRDALATRLNAPRPSPENIRVIAYRADIGCARDAAMLFASDADLPDCLAKLEQWDVPAFTVKGGDLIGKGLLAGPLVAKTLQAAEARWVEEGFPPADRQRAIADQLVADALSSSKKA